MSYVAEHEKDPGWPYLRLDPLKTALPDWFKTYDSKKSVWIPDVEDGFIAAEIKNLQGDMATVVSCKGVESTIKKDLCQEMNPAKFERTEDMSNLTMLNDASVLANLRSRYSQMLIYTYSGLFVVVINPYKRLPIYTDSVFKMYMGKRRNEMPPHLCAAADEAYRNMIQDRENQSMLITGESGAGKTENTKKVIAYFAVVGASQQSKGGEKTGPTLEDQIVQTNPVLESFGNAKTVRNNNSSRFGKFIRIHFDRTGKMAGGDIEHYLLEKSRSIKQNPGERCFHIFYQIMSGHIKGLREKLFLDKDIRYYHFQSQAEVTIDGVNDAEEMKITDEAFDVMGFSQAEKYNMYKISAALMHMGEIRFKQRGEQAEPEDDKDEATKTCALFGVNTDEYLTAVTKPRVKVGNEWVNKGQTVDQVNWGIGAMAKGIFARMFKWLVGRCNKTLDQKTADRDYFIGVLDIAGFEIFNFNSFEQLWINFVNEKLQQFFNHHMFILEQEEYQREGIVWTFIDFGLDLQATIELLEKPLGIVSMLDEECIVPKASDMTYAQKLADQHLGKHPNFEKPKPPKGSQAEAHFAIKHYAGTVRYNVIAWLEKNKDPLNDSCVAVMKASTENQLLLDMWSDYMTQQEQADAMKAGGAGGKKGKSGSFMTVSMMYRESLNNLMNMLQKTHPHFIRCIIPNEVKTSGLLDAALVLNQLTCNGVLEGIRICRKGFPNRMVHKDFKQRYALLAAEAAKRVEDPKQCCDQILQELKRQQQITDEHFRIGHTKVFFKAGILAHLEDLRDAKLSDILRGLQAKIRWFIALADSTSRAKQQRGLLMIQNNVLSWITVRTWHWFLLFGKIRPNLKGNKGEEEIQKLKDQIKEMEQTYAAEEEQRKQLEVAHAKLVEEKNAVSAELQGYQNSAKGIESTVAQLAAHRADLDKKTSDLQQRIAEHEEKANDVQRAKKRVEAEVMSTVQRIQELELALEKAQAETRAKEEQIKNLEAEMSNQDEAVAKLNREKKNQEEANRKVGDDLQANEEKLNYLNRTKATLEARLDELENYLEREKRIRQELEKGQRKAEGEMKLVQEKFDEISRRKQDSDSNLKRKEQELAALTAQLDEERILVSKLLKQLKEAECRAEEINEEVQLERQGRSKSEKSKTELQYQLNDLQDKLQQAGGATAAQIEMNRKREAELARVRKIVDDSNHNHETHLSGLKQKHNDHVSKVGAEIDELQQAKAKTEKEKTLVQREVEDARASIDAEVKGRLASEKVLRQYEVQLAEIVSKYDENVRQMNEFASAKARLTTANDELKHQLEAIDGQINVTSRANAQQSTLLTELKRTYDEELKEKQAVSAQYKGLENDNNRLRAQIVETAEAKAELLRQLSKVNAEIQAWRAKYESVGMAKAEEIEESRRKLLIQLQELTEHLEQINVKATLLEKTRLRLLTEVDDAHGDIERVNQYIQQLEKQQQAFDRIAEEWKRKLDDLRAELDASQREGRSLVTESFRLKTAMDELHENSETVKRENTNLAQEVRDLVQQLTAGGKSAAELQKIARNLELEKEELQVALDEAETALEAEQSKVLRAQLEASQIRQEIEKRIQEKEEEFENIRKNYQRSLEALQASIEAEVRGRAELSRIKKKLDADINELEVALEFANRANADAQRNLKRYQDQVVDLQTHLDTEQKDKEAVREQLLASEQKCSVLHATKLELQQLLESIERARKQLENDLFEAKEELQNQMLQNGSLTLAKKQLEAELNSLTIDLKDGLRELKHSEDQAAKAQADGAKLSAELRLEQEHGAEIEQQRKALEVQVRELQGRLDEAESLALKGGRKIISKLEQRIRELEVQLDTEQRRYSDLQRSVVKAENQAAGLQFQLDENKKNIDASADLMDKLQFKLKNYKRQLDETEEVGAINLAKQRQVQQQVDDTQERAEIAENALTKLRTKYRTATAELDFIQHSASAAVVRTPSRRGF